MIGIRLKNLREEINLTQKKLSELLELTPGAVGLYEQGRRTPDCDTLCKLANFYNVSVDYILCRTNKRNFERKASFYPEEIELLEKIRLLKKSLTPEQRNAFISLIEEMLSILDEKKY